MGTSEEPMKITVRSGPGNMPLGGMLQAQADAERAVDGPRRRGPGVCGVQRCWALPGESCMFPQRLTCPRRAAEEAADAEAERLAGLMGGDWTGEMYE